MTWVEVLVWVRDVGPLNFGVGSVGRNFGVGQKSSMGKCLAI